MSRGFYIGLLAIALAGAVSFFYRTSVPVDSPPATAEFGGVSLRMEYATTSAAREKGLGGRKNIAPDEAMLFVFTKDAVYGFWMKDMRVPLDIFWLDSQGHVVSIARDVSTSTYPTVFYPSMPARYVLETAAGFAREHSIVTGAPFILKNLARVSQ